MTNKIRFIHKGTSKDIYGEPEPISENKPTFFINEKRKRVLDDGKEIVTWKSCPAIHDIFISGYIIKTPCDIDVDTTSDVPVIMPRSSGHIDLIINRGVLAGYPVPAGHNENSYAWNPLWRVELPDGYSAMYTNPVNQNDLIFNTVSGIIDNDVFSNYGAFPFFIKSGIRQTVPAGTPFMQIFPFKRESWEQEIVYSDVVEEVKSQNQLASSLRSSKEASYFKKFWNRKNFK